MPTPPFFRRCLVSLLLAATPFAAMAGATALLPNAEAAFAPTASISSPGRIEVTFHIPEGYALYRDSVHATVTTPGVETGQLTLPQGKTVADVLGARQELHGNVTGTFSYGAKPDAAIPAIVEVRVHFQGCHKQAPQVCYPPAVQVFRLSPVRANAASQAGGWGG